MGADHVTASVQVDADITAVYEHFTNAEAMITWMGDRADLDPREGGGFSVDVDGSLVRGSYQTLDPPHRIVFTWGFVGSDVLPPGASTVEVRFRRVSGGTRVDLVHRLLPRDEMDKHAPGWRHFLDRLATAGYGDRPARADEATEPI